MSWSCRPYEPLPITNIFAPENGWLEDEISFWDNPIFGRKSLEGTVMHMLRSSINLSNPVALAANRITR